MSEWLSLMDSPITLVCNLDSILVLKDRIAAAYYVYNLDSVLVHKNKSY